jgi:hypothetical protein
MSKTKPIRGGANKMLLLRIAPELVKLIDNERAKLHTRTKQCTRTEYIREALWRSVDIKNLRTE